MHRLVISPGEIDVFHYFFNAGSVQSQRPAPHYFLDSWHSAAKRECESLPRGLSPNPDGVERFTSQVLNHAGQIRLDRVLSTLCRLVLVW